MKLHVKIWFTIYGTSRFMFKDDWGKCLWRLRVNEVLPQDTTHLIQRPPYQRGSLCQDPACNLTTRRPFDHRWDANWSGMDMSPVHQVWPKPSSKAQWKGEEDKADRGRGEKTTSGNGQTWSSLSPREKWRKLVVKSSVVPQRPPRLRDKRSWLNWVKAEIRKANFLATGKARKAIYSNLLQA